VCAPSVTARARTCMEAAAARLLALRGAITPCVECLTRPSFHAPRIGCSAPREHGHIRHSQTRLAFLYTLLRRFELALAHAYPGHPAHTPSLCPELRVTLTFLACCCHILEQCCPTRCVCVFHAVVPSYPPCRSNPRSTHAPHTRTGCALATLTRLGDPVSRHTHTHTQLMATLPRPLLQSTCELLWP
jgi:hypothetical protein